MTLKNEAQSHSLHLDYLESTKYEQIARFGLRPFYAKDLIFFPRQF